MESKEEAALGYFAIDQIMAVVIYTQTTGMLMKSAIPPKYDNVVFCVTEIKFLGVRPFTSELEQLIAVAEFH